eukprot:22381-Pyramimonas_sp.AAC.1
MNEVYVRVAPRARVLCPEAPETVTQAQMCKALRDDERPGVVLGEVSRRVLKWLPLPLPPAVCGRCFKDPLPWGLDVGQVSCSPQGMSLRLPRRP